MIDLKACDLFSNFHEELGKKKMFPLNLSNIRIFLSENMNKIIQDRVFEKKGPIPEDIWKKIFARSEAAHVDQIITSWGYKEGEVAIFPVMSTSPGSGAIMGTTWRVKGAISKTTIKASSVWPKAKKDVHLTWELSGKDFTFTPRDDKVPCNLSDWIDGETSGKLTATQGNNVIEWDDILEGEDKPGLSLR